MTPAAKKVLEDAVRPMRRQTQVTAQQVLAQILTLQPPDPAAVLLGALRVKTRRFGADWMRSRPTAESPATFTTSSEGVRIGPNLAGRTIVSSAHPGPARPPSLRRPPVAEVG